MIKLTARLKHSSSGFTLIELVVAFSIMAILGTVGIASFVNYSRAQALQQAVNNFSTALNTVKAASVAQVQNLNVNGQNLACVSGSIDGLGIAIGYHANSYTFYVKCSGAPLPTYSSVDTNLPTNVNFGSNTTSNVFFPVLTGGVTGSGNVVFVSPAIFGLSSKTVIIDSGGNIQVQ
jgi:prepilin-type N-terminal cleavage/methylation domain-containing protein